MASAPSNDASAEEESSARKLDSYAVPALDKGLDVLELMARVPQGLSRTQIARELNRTVSEIFRMLICLERRGYITQTTGERYSLSLKMFRLVQEHPPTERLIAQAFPVMSQLAHDTLQSCHLGVLDAGQVVIVAQVNAPTSLGFYVKLGSIVDIMESSSGYVLLAHQTDANREQILNMWRRESGCEPPRDLAVHLARIRRTGYEKRASYLVRGITNISFPIFDARQTAIAALTVPFIQFADSKVKDVEVIEALSRSAAEITAAVGGRGLTGCEGARNERT